MILQHALLLTQLPLSASLTLCLLNPSLKWCASRVVCNFWSQDIALLVPMLTWASTLLGYFFYCYNCFWGPWSSPFVAGGGHWPICIGTFLLSFSVPFQTPLHICGVLQSTLFCDLFSELGPVCFMSLVLAKVNLGTSLFSLFLFVSVWYSWCAR